MIVIRLETQYSTVTGVTLLGVGLKKTHSLKPGFTEFDQCQRPHVLVHNATNKGTYNHYLITKKQLDNGYS